MPEYCTAAQVQNRLTEAGVKHVADRNATGTVSATESAAYITSAIQYAGALIDAAIHEQCEPSQARGQASGGSCQWLVDRAVDIASQRAATHGGRDCPVSLTDAMKLSLGMLHDVQANRQPIPGLTYTYPTSGQSTMGCRVVNVN